ncbi:hypothetical protein ACTFIZ_007120 [Dictyostelium cf. discoideum]
MKFFAVICIVIFTLAFAYGCPNSQCGNDVSVTQMGVCLCIGKEFLDVELESIKIAEWDLGGVHYDQYNVQLHTRSGRTFANTTIILPTFSNNPQLALISAGRGIFGVGLDISGSGEPKLVLKSAFF